MYSFIIICLSLFQTLHVQPAIYFNSITGALSIAKFDRIFTIYFSKDLLKLCDELVYMIENEPTRKSRREQITICANLDVYHSGAELMLEMKELYGLTGDFKDMENIMASVSCSDYSVTLKDLQPIRINIQLQSLTEIFKLSILTIHRSKQNAVDGP